MKKIKQLLCVFALAIPFVAGAQSMQIRIATTSGDEQSFRSAEELMKTNFAKLKEVRIYSNSNNEVQVSEALLRRLFSEAQQLEVLEIKEVGIASFPELSVENKTLKVLVLRLNNLSKLPENIGSLSALQTIDIYNPITEVPVGRLPKLENVYFNANNLTKLPQALAENPRLTYVNINDNPLDFKQFIKSIEKIQWKGVLYINNRNFTTQQYEEVEKRLPRISVFYTQREE